MSTEATLTLAKDLLSWVGKVELSQPEPDRLDATLASSDDLVSMVTALRVKRLGYLAAITGLDLGPEAGEMEVLYHFCPGAATITLRVRVPREGATVPTLSIIIPVAESFERELSEMFGITVTGLRNPERLYLADDWPAGLYPMRKDFVPPTPEQA
ncbi:MAG: NADH-quinone oxidoreductase subunit C [Anaerolineae bacterium]|nr:NADH-quinone oxidoreductase subunit C [Anaerolineae bacterium]